MKLIQLLLIISIVAVNTQKVDLDSIQPITNQVFQFLKGLISGLNFNEYTPHLSLCEAAALKFETDITKNIKRLEVEGLKNAEKIFGEIGSTLEQFGSLENICVQVKNEIYTTLEGIRDRLKNQTLGYVGVSILNIMYQFDKLESSINDISEKFDKGNKEALGQTISVLINQILHLDPQIKQAVNRSQQIENISKISTGRALGVCIVGIKKIVNDVNSTLLEIQNQQFRLGKILNRISISVLDIPTTLVFCQHAFSQTTQTPQFSKDKQFKVQKDKRILMSIDASLDPRLQSKKTNKQRQPVKILKNKQEQQILVCLTQDFPTLITQVSVLIENLIRKSDNSTIRQNIKDLLHNMNTSWVQCGFSRKSLLEVDVATTNWSVCLSDTQNVLQETVNFYKLIQSKSSSSIAYIRTVENILDSIDESLLHCGIDPKLSQSDVFRDQQCIHYGADTLIQIMNVLKVFGDLNTQGFDYSRFFNAVEGIINNYKNIKNLCQKSNRKY